MAYIYIYIYIYISQWNSTQPKKRMKFLPFAATWVDLEGIMLNEMSDRERQILYDIIYM